MLKLLGSRGLDSFNNNVYLNIQIREEFKKIRKMSLPHVKSEKIKKHLSQSVAA